MSRLPVSSRGTVSLLALSLVTVLAISLAGYITISARSLRLANRAQLNGLASNLAESGIEHALAAINDIVNNNGSWGAWGYTAVGGAALGVSDTITARTIPLASEEFGSSGATGTINIRVQGRYLGHWDFSRAYTTRDIVWYLGRWWQCSSAHGPVTISQSPGSTANWVSAPSPWNALVSYAVGDIVLRDHDNDGTATAYRCLSANINSAPPSANWISAGTPQEWASTAIYSVNSVVTYRGTVYRCIIPGMMQEPTNQSAWAGAPVIYAEGIVTPPAASLSGSGGAVRVQVRAELAPVPLFPNALGGVSAVSLASTGNVGAYIPEVVAAAATTWTNGASYAVGNIVVDNNGYWRCISPHTASSARRPPNTLFWSNSLLQDYSAVVSGPSVTVSNSTNIWGHVAAPTTSFATGTVVKSATSPASPN